MVKSRVKLFIRLYQPEKKRIPSPLSSGRTQGRSLSSSRILNTEQQKGLNQLSAVWGSGVGLKDFYCCFH